MKYLKPIELADVERRELHLTLFGFSTIAVLAAGLGQRMYSAVFADPILSQNQTLRIALFGFYGLSCLLLAYIVDCQFTIRALGVHIAIDLMRASESLKQASADLLGTMPNFNTFADRLSMEFRRAVTVKLPQSVLVIAVKLRPDFSESSFFMSALGDAGRAVSRKLREQDSVCVLSPSFFGVVLPCFDTSTARRVSDRFSESRSVAAGGFDRFSFKIDAIHYPEHAATLHDLEFEVCGYQPEADRSGVS